MRFGPALRKNLWGLELVSLENVCEPVVSVVIPCFNQGQFLSEALDSVISQSYRPLEVIVVDDGSTDDTPEIASEFVNRHSWIKYVRQSNQGPAHARNRGIEASVGQWIQFLDADDFLLPGKIQFQIESLRGTTLGVSFCDYEFQDETGRRYRSKYCTPRLAMARPLYDIALRWETHLSIPIHAFLFDARVFKKSGLRFDPTLPTNEDWDCWLRVFSLPVQVVRAEVVGCVYRVLRNSRSRDREKMWRGFHQAAEKQLARSDLDDEAKRLIRRKLRIHDDDYAKTARARMRNWLDENRVFRSQIPWPVQRALFSLVSALRGELDALDPKPTQPTHDDV